MAGNYVQPGKTLTLAAPYQRNTGEGALVGAIFGVALQTVANTVAGEFATEGVWDLAATSAQVWAVGDKIYWDNGTKKADNVSTVGQLIGVATAIKANPGATGRVRLNGNAPATAEGAQAAIVDLTDNSGGAGADSTIGAIGVPAALVDNSAGAAADGTIEAMANPTDAPATADALRDDIVAVLLPAIRNNVADLAAKANAQRTSQIALTDAVKELATKVNAILADLRAAGIVAP